MNAETPSDLVVARTVLLVDDSATILLAERRILGADFEFLTARDGQDAVTQATARRPDLILLDIEMPRMDGLEALRRIRENDVTRHIPVILVTSRGDESIVERGYEAGCSDYVVKPIDASELREKVRSLLDASEA